MVKQISVFVENKKGRLHKLTELLAENNIDLRALSIADTADFGILRCIVEDPDEALRIIRENNFTASITQVIAAEISDAPGGLSAVLGTLIEHDISVEYLYCFVKQLKSKAIVVFRVQNTQEAKKALAEMNIRTLDSNELFADN